jgi:uncharacterized protein (DUF2147 family)
MDGMKRIFAKAALLVLAVSVPASALAQEPVEGRWRNPKNSVTVKIAPCGSTWCGYVVDASEHAKQSAREGGTENLIGTRILTGLRKTGDNTFKGQAFDPKRNIRAPATIRVLSATQMSVKGCVFGGLICREWRWTRVS